MTVIATHRASDPHHGLEVTPAVVALGVAGEPNLAHVFGLVVAGRTKIGRLRVRWRGPVWSEKAMGFVKERRLRFLQCEQVVPPFRSDAVGVERAGHARVRRQHPDEPMPSIRGVELVGDLGEVAHLVGCRRHGHGIHYDRRGSRHQRARHGPQHPLVALLLGELSAREKRWHVLAVNGDDSKRQPDRPELLASVCGAHLPVENLPQGIRIEANEDRADGRVGDLASRVQFAHADLSVRTCRCRPAWRATRGCAPRRQTSGPSVDAASFDPDRQRDRDFQTNPERRERAVQSATSRASRSCRSRICE